VPGKTGDAKYYYAQNIALHYLMTGDDRFREGAEDVAEAYAALWADPGTRAATTSGPSATPASRCWRTCGR
jgi:hypothetical protein